MAAKEGYLGGRGYYRGGPQLQTLMPKLIELID